MAVEFQMPKLGLTMESGRIVEWLVADATAVQQGEAVLVVETDKVDTDIEASGSGVLHITAAAGETIECGGRIGWFLEPDEPLPAVSTTAIPSPTTTSRLGHDPSSQLRNREISYDGARLLASPNARRVAAQLGVDIARVVGSGPAGRIVSEDVVAARQNSSQRADAAVDATHAAHQIANRLGVDLRAVRPSGPQQRIDRADVERFVRDQLTNRQQEFRPDASSATPAHVEAALLQTPSSTIALTGMRGTIALRMHTSLRDMAQLTLTMDAVMDAVVQHRAATDPTRRAGYTDYVVAAVAAETTRLANAARSGTLARPEVEGGTFSVTALGMYGVDAFTPVINPPNTAILGVGRLRDGVRWDDDVPVQTKLATLSFTWDHRAFDGVPAAEFTAAVRDHLEAWGTA